MVIAVALARKRRGVYRGGTNGGRRDQEEPILVLHETQGLQRSYVTPE